ncbi:carotenoid ester lipase precursor [Lentinus tigrinus ALCF2SS1-7]|uniref:Carboxylic ester hydrolase n=1 Tax=Lentinus tigrinus ALCF2SS1-6 TaxID=1328759 RepID=A0A5C2S6K8_9APHY|nr:carotenoid ester lipase precursor [Lentinus tigrinus ALCF2SS1-6]RPD68947.1 carotenoid ester lipase precursor [Lentinus tigrinus ALCF2SS1-7]
MLARLTFFIQLALSLQAGSTAAASSASSSSAAPGPTVTLDKATVLGTTNGSVTSYIGIPYAQPPIGDLRLRLPVLLESYNGTIDATRSAAAQCPQLQSGAGADLPPEIEQDVLAYSVTVLPVVDVPEDEDCLTINVQVPSGAKPDDGLPVIAFIYGGGFTVGSTAWFPGQAFVEHSISMDQPVVFVAMNYRLNVFGFLGGKEIKEAGVGNLGLQDQRAALRWINKHISAFGGDPAKVTIWGPSAGAMSVAMHMLTDGGNAGGLFRAAIMDSGSPLPTGDTALQQWAYDSIVEQVGCANATGTTVADTDTVQCLRGADGDALLAAAGTFPGSSAYPGAAAVIPWNPHADGVFLTAHPQELVLAGSVADVPFISGDVLDEGTLFATPSFNITTDDEFETFIHDYFFPNATQDELAPVYTLYPNDPAQGSPFGTGDDNQLSPQYKRMAAIQGDVLFQAPRRFFLDHVSSRQPVWSFRNERGPFKGLGYPHASEFNGLFFDGDDLADYIIQFVSTLDPNGGSNRTINWPRYNEKTREVLVVLDGDVPLRIGNDSARRAQTDKLAELTFKYPL